MAQLLKYQYGRRIFEELQLGAMVLFIFLPLCKKNVFFNFEYVSDPLIFSLDKKKTIPLPGFFSNLSKATREPYRRTSSFDENSKLKGCETVNNVEQEI